DAVLFESTGSVRTFDLATGRLVAETSVTGGLDWVSSPAGACVTLGDDRFVALLRESTTRGAYLMRCTLTAFDRKTGRSLWTKDVARGVPVALLLDGAASVVAVFPPSMRFTRGVTQPPEYQIVVASLADGSDVRISSAGLGDVTPSAVVVDG